MKKINLWESSLRQNFIFFDNLENYFDYLTSNNLNLDFITKESYTPDQIETSEDTYAKENDVMFIYTDKNHPIAFSKNKTYIHPVFFEKHIEKFKRFARISFEKELIKDKLIVTIPNFIVTDSLLSILTFLKRNKIFEIKEFSGEITLTEDQKKLLRDNFIALRIKKRFSQDENISSRYVISNLTLDDLKLVSEIYLEIPNDKDNLNNLIYLNEKTKLILAKSPTCKDDEINYFNIIKKIFKILSTVNHTFNIEIKVTNRMLFNDSHILEEIPSNINLSIENNRYTYTPEEYQKEEEKIEKLIKPIRESDLSPLEKHIAIFNLVKKFKQYKAYDCSKVDGPCAQGSALKYVLEDDNEYIVCEGYARLLKEFHTRVGIPCQEEIVFVDISKDEDYDPSKSDRGGHDRNLVLINDDKYNIHGYYLSDPTFDSYEDADLYLNCLMTFDHKKTARRLEYIIDEDLLFDFHNFDEFKKKINFYLRRKIDEQLYDKELDNVQYAYMELYRCIMRKLKQIDYNKYTYFYNKYNKYLTDYTLDITKLEKIANNMLTEYSEYIIPLSNNPVSFETILTAATVVKKKIDGYSDEQVEQWLKQTIDINEDIGNYTQPYIYNPNYPEGYLTDKPKSKIKEAH